MKFCPECGTKLEGSETKCPICGYQISDELADIQISTDDSVSGNKTVLIDYYEKTVGTPVEMPYYEIVLYKLNDKEVMLEEYTNGGMKNEVCKSYPIDHDAYDEALQIVERYELKKHLNDRGDGMEGKKFVIKFRESEDAQELYRISSEDLDDMNCYRAFTDMLALLRGYLKR